jgi:signal peptide peptidase SppA
MAHSVPRIKARMINNTPHLIENESFQVLLDYLESRDNLTVNLPEMAISNNLNNSSGDWVLGEGSVAYIPINGTLTYEDTMWSALCGMTSYQSIVSQMKQAASEGYRTVVLDIDSGGGEAYQTFSTARTIRKIADENDMKLISYVDGMAASAAYALAATSHEIIAHPQSEVGSIGVVTRLTNTNARDMMEGITTTYIYAGGSKIPYAEDGSFRKDFLEDIQEKVDVLYDEFVGHVASSRGIEESVVMDTDAKVFTASKAMTLGLIDTVMEVEEFAEYLADMSDKEARNMPINIFKSKKEEDMPNKKSAEGEQNTLTLTELQEVNTTLQASLEEAQIGFTELQQAHDLAQEELVSALAEVEKLKAALEEASTETKNLVEQKRKKALEDVTSEEEATVLYASLSSLDDTAFDAVVASFAKKATTLEQSDLFQEQGNSQKAEDQPSDKPSLKDKINKKYNTEGAK